MIELTAQKSQGFTLLWASSSGWSPGEWTLPVITHGRQILMPAGFIVRDLHGQIIDPLKIGTYPFKAKRICSEKII
jgi:hypothetical protein